VSSCLQPTPGYAWLVCLRAFVSLQLSSTDTRLSVKYTHNPSYISGAGVVHSDLSRSLPLTHACLSNTRTTPATFLGQVSCTRISPPATVCFTLITRSKSPTLGGRESSRQVSCTPVPYPCPHACSHSRNADSYGDKYMTSGLLDHFTLVAGTNAHGVLFLFRACTHLYACVHGHTHVLGKMYTPSCDI
jgi:hypothetical protein